MIWMFKCVKCGRERKYKYKKNYKNASCRYCWAKQYNKVELERSCPECKNIIKYKNRKSYNLAKKKNSSCHKCWANSDENKKRRSKQAKELFWSGENPYYDEWVKSLSEANKGRKFSDETILKRVATRASMTVEEYQKSLPEYEKYRRRVRRITNQQPLYTLFNIEKRGRTTYHLDHIISVAEGFRKNILPEIIGNIENLQMLPAKENLIKSDKTIGE